MLKIKISNLRTSRANLYFELSSSIGSFESKITTLVAGVDEHELLVHQDILSKKCPYFTTAIKKEWKEGRERRFPLPVDSPAAVDLYVQWLYGSRIFSQKPLEELEEGYDELGVLIDSFIFGEKIQDDHLKDAVIYCLIVSVSTLGKEGRH